MSHDPIPRPRVAPRCAPPAVAAVLLLGLLAGCSADGRSAPPGPPVVVGHGDTKPELLDPYRARQEASVAEFGVFHEFGFTDRVADSGITFVHDIVEDAGKHWKPVHYDHGNGVLVADVDGDDRLDLYFMTQLGANELWKNLGGGKFRDVTESAGVGVADRIGVSGAFGDIDNDGDPDLFVTTVKMGNLLFENDGTGMFTDITEQAGVGYVGHSSAALFFDYDRDGLLDLFVTNVGTYTTEQRGPGGYYIGVEEAFSGHLYPERTEISRLYRNLGGNRFEDVSEASGLTDGGWTGDASFVDFDRDHDLDLYVLNMQGDDHYWENRDGRFVERTGEHFPKSPWGAMGIKFFDWNLDGRLDLLLTDMHSDMSAVQDPAVEKRKSEIFFDPEFLASDGDNIWGNAFWENRGGGTFEEISDENRVENYWPWGVSVDDLNADGWDDVFIASSMNYPFRYGVNSVLLNDGGEVFRESAFLLGIEPRRDGKMDKEWFRLDCSGADRGHRHCEGREGEVIVRGALGTRSSVIFDLDDDGDLDIVTGEFNAEPQVLVSDLSDRRDVRHLKVRLRGTVSNRSGIGATVRVHAGSRVLLKLNDGKSGYLSQSELPLYFGLGDATAVDRVDVTWPTGRTQTVTRDIPVGGTLVIEEER